MPGPDPSSSSAKQPLKSGIVERATGERLIPSSTRADGSVRKEIKIRPGYQNPDDVEAWKPRNAQASRNRPKSGVPGAAFVDVPTHKPKKPSISKAPPVSRATGTAPPPEPTPEPTPKQELQEEVEPVDPEVEKQKEVRKLCKKLRQARELRSRQDQGDSILPEQLQKIIQINELTRQLDKLGFDREGQHKVKDNTDGDASANDNDPRAREPTG